MDEMAKTKLVELTAEIISAYVSNNEVVASELPALIQDIHQALSRVTNNLPAPEREELRPAIPIKRSVTPDYIICLEDGKKFKSSNATCARITISLPRSIARSGAAPRLPNGGAEQCGCALGIGQEDGSRHAASNKRWLIRTLLESASLVGGASVFLGHYLRLSDRALAFARASLALRAAASHLYAARRRAWRATS